MGALPTAAPGTRGPLPSGGAAAGRSTSAVLLMALGAPTSLDEVEPFLRDLRGGRPTPPELIEEFRERYRRIGGASPLLEVSRSQATALERRLADRGWPVPCTVGMRHWAPRIDAAVRELSAAGVRDLVALSLTPYYSNWSVGGYLDALRAAVSASGASLRIHPVRSWHRSPSLAEAFAARVREGRSALAASGAADPYVLFTAHSLPEGPESDTETYVRHLDEARAAILGRLPPVRSAMAYQSVGRRGGSWLGPSMEARLDELTHAGERSVLVVPYGFVSDNLEILYDIDIELRARADERGIRLERTPSLNADPGLVEAMAEAVLAVRPGRPD